MFRYIIKRLIQMIPLLFIVSIISFGVTKLAPGDPIQQLRMNPAITQERIEAERQRLGLDRPIYVQYWRWVTHFVQGDLGDSYTYKTSVTTLIGQRLGNTLILGVSVLLFTWLIAIPLGIFAAVRQYSKADMAISVFSYVAMGFTDFFLAILLMLFAAWSGILPVSGMTDPNTAAGFFNWAWDVGRHLILPTVAIGIGSIALLQRRMRANLLDVLHEDYIKMARAKGLPENVVIYRHAVRNAINPIITILGYELASLISGAALVEIIFSWPGLGQMMLEAVLSFDYNLVMASLVIGAFMLMIGNLISDLLLAAVDPRIKLEA